MAAFTTFLNLYKPGGGSSGLITPDEVVDIDRVNQNMDDIDAWAQSVNTDLKELFFQAGTVTTTTEPTTGRQGLVFNFPQAFAVAPVLIVMGHISPGGNRVAAVPAISTITPTQGGIYYTSDTNYGAGAQATFQWLAFGTKP